MNILIAVDSFKGSLPSRSLADAIEQGIREAGCQGPVAKVPIADGGEGTCDTLLDGLGGTPVTLTVKGPLFEDVQASYGILGGDTAIMEMSACSGLPLVPVEKRNPLNTTTYGLGQMILDAMERGCREFIIGIGGSATNDGGIGMLSALGCKFLDEQGDSLTPVGGALSHIRYAKTTGMPETLKECHFLIACDVENPFYGEQGAACIFGPQKGADPACVQFLDRGLRHWAGIIEAQCGINVGPMKGAGAAGGLGGGFSAFLGADLKPGAEIIFDYLGMESKIREADLIITGEGRLDHQSIMGKAPSAMARLAARHGKPIIAMAGHVSDDAVSLHDHGMTAMFSIADGPISLEEAMDPAIASRLVTKKTAQIMRLVNRFQFK